MRGTATYSDGTVLVWEDGVYSGDRTLAFMAGVEGPLHDTAAVTPDGPWVNPGDASNPLAFVALAQILNPEDRAPKFELSADWPMVGAVPEQQYPAE